MKKTHSEEFYPPLTELSQLFRQLPRASLSPKTSPLKTFQKLTRQDREKFQIFLWYEIYSHLLKTLEIQFEEKNMFNHQLIKTLLIELADEGETIEGIALATHLPSEILKDIALGLNANPSIAVSVKIIGYYILIKRSEYTEFIRKILQWVSYNYNEDLFLSSK